MYTIVSKLRYMHKSWSVQLRIIMDRHKMYNTYVQLHINQNRISRFYFSILYSYLSIRML